MRRIIAALAIMCSIAFSEDLEMNQGNFKSENNLIEEIHFEMARNRIYFVVKLKNKLTGKNSRAKVMIDKRSSSGDSISSYAYVEIEKEDLAKSRAVETAHSTQCPVDVVYNCGEQPDDKRRRLFPFYVETNCQVEAITIKKPKEKRSW